MKETLEGAGRVYSNGVFVFLYLAFSVDRLTFIIR